MLRLANFFMRLEARLSYALIGLVQATGYAGGLDCYGYVFIFCYQIQRRSSPSRRRRPLSASQSRM